MRGLRPLLFSLFSPGYCLSRSSVHAASLSLRLASGTLRKAQIAQN